MAKSRIDMKVVKGMRDYSGDELVKRDVIISHMTEIFKSHGAIQLDTPVAELKSTLQSRYGAEEKLIFDLADQGGEISSLRYDLTVPLMRYLAINNLSNLKRYQIGKVYRRDQPNTRQARYREFMQVDYDIVGACGPMIAEAEVMCVMVSCLERCNLTDFVVSINDRRLLNAILFKNGIEENQIKTVCSSIDKLDKQPWEEIATELICKGIDRQILPILKRDISRKGSFNDMMSVFDDNQNGDLRSEYQKLSKYIRTLGLVDKLEIDLSLARGLDYYEGLVFEVRKRGIASSIAAGGRYSASLRSDKKLPAVGLSIGLDRLMRALEDEYILDEQVRSIKVGIVTAGEVSPSNVFRICKILWDAEIYCAYDMRNIRSATSKQVQKYIKENYSFIVFLGEKELESNHVIVKKVSAKTQREIRVEDLVDTIQSTKSSPEVI